MRNSGTDRISRRALPLLGQLLRRIGRVNTARSAPRIAWIGRQLGGLRLERGDEQWIEVVLEHDIFFGWEVAEEGAGRDFRRLGDLLDVVAS